MKARLYHRHTVTQASYNSVNTVNDCSLLFTLKLLTSSSRIRQNEHTRQTDERTTECIIHQTSAWPRHTVSVPYAPQSMFPTDNRARTQHESHGHRSSTRLIARWSMADRLSKPSHHGCGGPAGCP